MRSLYAICLATLLAAPVAAQEWAWARAGHNALPAEGSDLDLDGAGNAFISGLFADSLNLGSVTLTTAGLDDTFIAKYAPDGTLLWARSGGGPDLDWAYCVAADAAGNGYLTGMFNATATFGPFTLTSAGSRDVFVVKYAPNGDVLWAQRAGGVLGDRGVDVDVDAAGNVYVSGVYTGTADFGLFTVTALGSSDAFVAKYSPAGEVLWVRSGGGATGNDWAEGVAVDDATGAVFIAGYFDSATASFGPNSLPNAGGWEAFVAKYASDGTELWARSIGGTGEDRALPVEVDAAGNAYVGGWFSGTATAGPVTLTSAGVLDGFTLKYGPDGDLLWARTDGGDETDRVRTLRVTPGGDVTVVGDFSTTASIGGFSLESAGLVDLFVVEYDALGTAQWATRAGGPGRDIPLGVGIGSDGALFIAGDIEQTAQFGPHTLTSAGAFDPFVARLNTGATANEPSAGDNYLHLDVAPNPVSGVASISIRLDAPGPARLEVFDALGRRVDVLLDRTLAAGVHRIDVDARELLPGYYMLRLGTTAGTTARPFTAGR